MIERNCDVIITDNDNNIDVWDRNVDIRKDKMVFYWTPKKVIKRKSSE